jgi:hypothetical protein
MPMEILSVIRRLPKLSRYVDACRPNAPLQDPWKYAQLNQFPDPSTSIEPSQVTFAGEEQGDAVGTGLTEPDSGPWSSIQEYSSDLYEWEAVKPNQTVRFAQLLNASSRKLLRCSGAPQLVLPLLTSSAILHCAAHCHFARRIRLQVLPAVWTFWFGAPQALHTPWHRYCTTLLSLPSMLPCVPVLLMLLVYSCGAPCRSSGWSRTHISLRRGRHTFHVLRNVIAANERLIYVVDRDSPRQVGLAMASPV